MKKQILHKNAGYSLLEVIIVVSITAVLTGAVFLGVSLINSRAVDSCAKKMKLALEGNRTTTMGKLSASITFYMDDDGYIVIDESINGSSKKRKIGGSSLTVQYVCDGTPKPMPNEAQKLTLEFSRSTGSLKKQASGDDAGKYIEKFVISQSGTVVEVAIDKLTGKVSINK